MENPEDPELKCTFKDIFHYILIFHFLFWMKQLKIAMQLFSHV